MKPTKEQLADPKWWDDSSNGYDYAFYLEKIGQVKFADESGNSKDFGIIIGQDAWQLLAKRPEPLAEPENETIFWVAKLDQYGTPWNTDGPHESYSKANEGCELLKQVNKKEKYIVTEMTFKKIKTQREELIDMLCANNGKTAEVMADAILARFDLTEKDGK